MPLGVGFGQLPALDQVEIKSPVSVQQVLFRVGSRMACHQAPQDDHEPERSVTLSRARARHLARHPSVLELALYILRCSPPRWMAAFRQQQTFEFAPAVTTSAEHGHPKTAQDLLRSSPTATQMTELGGERTSGHVRSV
jgi:hypothetical protein